MKQIARRHKNKKSNYYCGQKYTMQFIGVMIEEAPSATLSSAGGVVRTTRLVSTYSKAKTFFGEQLKKARKRSATVFSQGAPHFLATLLLKCP